MTFKTCLTEMTEIDSLKKSEKQKSKLASKPFCLDGKQKNKFYSLVVFQVLGGKSSLKNKRNSKIKIIIFKRQLIIKTKEEITLRLTASIKYRAVLWLSAVRFSQPLFFPVERKTLRKALHFMLANRQGAPTT